MCVFAGGLGCELLWCLYVLSVAFVILFVLLILLGVGCLRGCSLFGFVLGVCFVGLFARFVLRCGCLSLLVRDVMSVLVLGLGGGWILVWFC